MIELSGEGLWEAEFRRLRWNYSQIHLPKNV